MLDYTRDILPYLEADGPRHAYYQASVAHRDQVRRVFRRAYPVYLDLNRPKESTASKLYRRAVYKNGFRTFKSRYVEVLDYIPQADDYSVTFDEVSQSADTLETYCGHQFSPDGSTDDWFWRRVRPMYVTDPNAVLLVLPMQQPAADTVRYTPTAMLIPCEKVYQHKKGRYCVVELPHRPGLGRRLAFIDADSYAIATLVGGSKETKQWLVLGVGVDETGTATFRPALHGCGCMPAVKLGKLQEIEAEAEPITSSLATATAAVGGVLTERIGAGQVGRMIFTIATDPDEEFYESPISVALPHIQTAQQISSDLDVERNLHVSSQEWRYATKACPDEKLDGDNRCVGGTKILRDADGKITNAITCPTCKGTSMHQSGSGTEIIAVTPPTANSMSDEGRPTNLPIPPGGFIPRDIAALHAFVEEYKRAKAEAYATINMEFLMSQPLAESGTSKRADREALYRELNTQAAHLCSLLRITYTFIGQQRYGVTTSLPTVVEPVRFSIENAELTREELAEAVKNGYDNNLRKPLEKKLIAYQTGKDSLYYRRYALRELLDPLPGKDDEAKLFLLATMRVILTAGSKELQQITEETALSLFFDGILSAELRKSGEAFWSLDPTAQYDRMLTEAKNRVGTLAGPMIDPATGKPLAAGSMATLQPFVNVKNNNQIH